MTEALDIQSPRLRIFYDHWNRLPRRGPVPERRAFDIREAPRELVAHLILLDVLDGGRDFRYRVVGTEVVSRIGREFTGETVQEYHDRHESLDVRNGYIEVVTQGQPHVYSSTLHNIGKEFLSYERVAVPLLGEGGDIDYILACFEFWKTEHYDL